MHTLCSMDVCTTALILGAFRVSLQQGRFIVLIVLHEIIESLKTFILNIKQAVPISPKSSIKFVKKGIKVQCKRTPPVGILHQASGWGLLVDLYEIMVFQSILLLISYDLKPQYSPNDENMVMKIWSHSTVIRSRST